MKLKIKQVRERKNLTQRKMAKLLGVSKSSYNYYESGERMITIERLNDFCNMFNVSFDYILGLQNTTFSSKKKYQINKELIGQRLKEIRKDNKLTQKDVADILNTTQSTICFYEKGKTLILTPFLYEIAKKLNVSADYIVGRSNTKKILINDNNK